MCGLRLPTRIPEGWQLRWAEVAEKNGFMPVPQLVLDPSDAWPVTPRRAEIERTNRARAETLRAQLLPSLVRHVYPSYRFGATPIALLDTVRDAAGDPPLSRAASLQTKRRRILLRAVCPASLIQRLHADPGLAGFTRRAEREHAIALRVASTGHGTDAVAHTDSGTIVGQLVLTPAPD
jgi:hypothetical protein